MVLWGRQEKEEEEEEEGKRNGYRSGECSNEDVLLAAPTKPMFFLVSDYVAPHCATYTLLPIDICLLRHFLTHSFVAIVCWVSITFHNLVIFRWSCEQ